MINVPYPNLTRGAHPDRVERLVVRTLAGVLLVASILLVYGEAREYEFIALDDDVYVLENENVRAGISRESVVWSLGTFHTGNWHPVTWLSHMIDVEMFGLDAGAHHAVNIAIHAVNSLLLFAVMLHFTSAFWRSLLVASLFAVHPLHVESVVWISERKDVLCTLFWLAGMWAYGRYAQRPSVSRYLVVLLLLVLGLMSKAMLVTFPFVLLLLDYWPLKRANPQQGVDNEVGEAHRLMRNLVAEKLPLFALVAISASVTLVAQESGGAIRPLEEIPLDFRVANALVSYLGYIVKTVLPVDLAIYYPLESSLPWWQSLAAGMAIAAISCAVIIARGSRPYLAVGWFWYLGTLVPVIGLVQVGGQAMADRYSYVPSIGLYVAAAWAVADLVLDSRVRKLCSGVLAGSAVLVLAYVARAQVGYWQNSIVLLERTIEVTGGSPLIHNNLGVTLMERGELAHAGWHFRESLRSDPNYVDALINLGVAELNRGDFDRAIVSFRSALMQAPDSKQAADNLELALAEQRKGRASVLWYRRAHLENSGERYEHRGDTYEHRGDAYEHR